MLRFSECPSLNRAVNDPSLRPLRGMRSDAERITKCVLRGAPVLAQRLAENRPYGRTEAVDFTLWSLSKKRTTLRKNEEFIPGSWRSR